MLELQSLSRHFGSLKVIDNLDLWANSPGLQPPSSPEPKPG